MSKRSVVDTPYGFQLAVPLDGLGRAIRDGCYEQREILVMQDLLKGADVFVDIGANVGLYSCLARKKGKTTVAVEPQRRNLDLLYLTLVRNDWQDVEVVPMCLTDRHGVSCLYGDSGPSASLLEGWANASSRQIQMVSTTTLDDIVHDRFLGKRLLIKMDVEGAEYLVLSGAERTLSRQPRPTWMVEIFLDLHHPGGINSRYLDIFQMFWQKGYNATTVGEKPLIVTPEIVQEWIRNGRCDRGIMNFIFS